jgi:hypothetical protein
MEKHQQKKRSMLRHLRLADHLSVLKKKTREPEVLEEQVAQPEKRPEVICGPS